MSEPHEQIRQTREACALHTRHIPETHINEVHHVWPKGEGGPDILANKVVVCATGHNNVHELIKLFKLHKGTLPYSELRRFSLKEREYAKLGYDRLTRGAM